jgi:hypothetical protein
MHHGYGSLEKNKEDLYKLFNLPLSTIAHEEFHDLKEELDAITIISV